MGILNELLLVRHKCYKSRLHRRARGHCNPTTVTITNSYWDKETTLQKESAGQETSFGKTTDEMKKQETYEGWKFDTIWTIQEGISYPTLINNPERH